MKTSTIIYALAIMILIVGIVFIRFDYVFIGGVFQGASLGVAYWSGVKSYED